MGTTAGSPSQKWPNHRCRQGGHLSGERRPSVAITTSPREILLTPLPFLQASPLLRISSSCQQLNCKPTPCPADVSPCCRALTQVCTDSYKNGKMVKQFDKSPNAETLLVFAKKHSTIAISPLRYAAALSRPQTRMFSCARWLQPNGPRRGSCRGQKHVARPPAVIHQAESSPGGWDLLHWGSHHRHAHRSYGGLEGERESGNACPTGCSGATGRTSRTGCAPAAPGVTHCKRTPVGAVGGAGGRFVARPAWGLLRLLQLVQVLPLRYRYRYSQ